MVLLSVFSGKIDFRQEKLKTACKTTQDICPRELQRPGTQLGPQQLGISLSLINTESFGEDARYEFVEELFPLSVSLYFENLYLKP